MMEALRRYGRSLRKHERRLWVLVGIQFTIVAGFSASMAFFALYLHGERGVPMVTVGLLVMLASLAAAPSQLISGAASDRVGRRPLTYLPLIGQGLVFFVMSALVVLGASPLLLGVGLIAARVLGASFLAAADAILSDITRPEDRAEGYSLIRVGGNLGWSAGPALGGLIAERSYALVFAFTGCFSLTAAFLAWRGLSESLAPGGRQGLGRPNLRLLGQDRPFMVLALGSFFLFVTMGHMIVPLSIYTVEWLGISKARFGALCSINGLMVVLFQHATTLFLRGRAGAGLLAVSGLLYSAGYLSLVRAASFSPLVGSMVILTVAELLFVPVSVTLVSRLAPADRRGEYLGAFGLVRMTGWAVAPFVGGVLLGAFPQRPLPIWGTVAAMGVVGALILWLGRAVVGREMEARAAPLSPEEEAELARARQPLTSEIPEEVSR